MTENKIRKRHVFNWVDLLILLLAVALAGMVILNLVKTDNRAGFGDKVVKLEYVIRIDKISEDLNLQLNTGDSVTEMTSKNKIGVLSSNASLTAYQENIFNEKTNAIEIFTSDNFLTAHLTVSAEAVETEYGYYINGVRIAVGKDYSLRISGLEATGSCVGIEVKEDQQ